MSARRSIIPVFVPHVGCPNDCVFCNQRRISGAVRPVTPDEVSCAIQQGAAITSDEVERQLAFYGGSFTAIPQKAQEMLLGAAQPYLLDGTIASIRVSTRPDAIDEETLLRLRRYGVGTVELGAQSMNDVVLMRAGRGHTSAQVVEAANLVKQFGFELVLQMMTGLPGDEDGAASMATAHALAALHPDGVRIYPTVIIKDTALYEMWKQGEYQEHTVDEAVRVCARIVPVFEQAGIPVIRLGLNPTEDLSNGDAVAGAYHPALGELVKSRMMLDRVRGMMLSANPHDSLQITVGKGKISQMVGQKRCNIRALESEFGLKDIKIVETNEKSDEILVNFIAKSVEI